MRDSPSKTALVIACAVLVLGGDEYGRQRLPPTCLRDQIQLLKAAGMPIGNHPIVISNPIFSKLVRWFLNVWFRRSLLEGIGFRKVYMEQRVRHAITETKMEQVLVIAAGYDVLAWRLSQESSSSAIQLWEVDHAATGLVKKRALSRITEEGERANEHLHLITVDLTECSLPQAMEEWNTSDKSNAFDTTKRSVVVMEGLLMYLTQHQIINLFRDLSTMVGKGSIVCFDYMAWNHDVNRVDMRLSAMVHGLVNTFGEPWHWGMDRERLPDFFQKHLPMYKVTDQQPRVGIENVACVTFV